MHPMEWPDLQKIHKNLMSFALNTDSIEDWVRVCRGYYNPKRRPKQGPISDRKLQEFLLKFHPAPIKDLLFNKDLGLRLMYTESRITDGIIRAFVDRSIPILPINDGFICPSEHEDLLKDSMVSIYTEVTGKGVSGIHKEH